MAVVSEYGPFVLPGGVINVGYLKKGIGGEGYLAYFPGAGLLGFLFGGNIVANPFSDQPISPCLSTGILVSPVGFGIWNAGGGLKIKFTRNLGIRMEYRYCRAFTFSSDFQFGFGMLVGGIFFSN